MTGRVEITEYTNMGDVASETPVEPCHSVHAVSIGGDHSAEIGLDTRLVVLFATFPCRVSFTADEHDEALSWPLPANVETVRMVRPNTRMTVKAYDERLG